MSSPYTLAPWTSLVRPHSDVTSGALDMGTYAANLAGVFRHRPATPEVYLQADRFFAATYLTDGLRHLLTDALRVLAGGPGDRVLQLRTPFGGGKTHTLVALLHLARDREALVDDPQVAQLPDPGPVQVAVLSGEELDPVNPVESSGVATRTLWGELGAQLGRYELVAEQDVAGSAPGGDTLRRVLGDGPVLVLLDEVLVYIEKAMAVTRGETTLGRQAMLFVQALTEAVNAHPRAAMVYSLQASVGEAVGAEGLLSQLDHLVSRIDAKREPVTGDEVMRVVQRRLFTDLGDPSTHRTVAAAHAELLRRQLVAQAETTPERREAESEARRLEERIVTSYPLHPALLDLMYHRWGSLPSYQRTRGALQFLASVVHAGWRGSSAAALIGPGDIDLADEATRGAFFSQVGERERYTSVLSADITSAGSGAASVDRQIGSDSPGLERLAVGTRMATAIMLFSFGSRQGEDRGVLESDLVAATLVPGLDRNVIVAALHDLREEELYLHYTGRRYRFEPTPNLTKLVRDEANKLTGDEVLADIREQLETQLGRGNRVAVWPDGPGGVRDRVPGFTIAYLHPDWDHSPPVERFIEDAAGGKRIYRNALAVVLPDRPQFDRARIATRSRIAAESLLARRSVYGFSMEQAEELREKAAGAGRDASTAIGRAYRHVAIPVRAGNGADRPYHIEEIDLRTLLSAGRSLHDRVLDALSHRVFDSVTAAKLITLAGLGPDRPVVRCADLAEHFFSYFDFTKITSQQVVAEAISTAVAGRQLGYAVGLTESGDTLAPRDPGRVRFGVPLAVDEIDLSADAAVIAADLAAELTAPAAAPGTPTGAAPTAEVPTGGPTEVNGGPQDEPPGPTDHVREVALRARLSKPGLFGLGRALSWLREQAEEVDVEVAVTARSSAGFDRVRLRNAVVEPLEEGGSDPEVRLS